MTPETFALLREFGLPLVGLVAVAFVLYRTLMGVIDDLRKQRDAANVRADALVGGMQGQIKATEDLTGLVRSQNEMIRTSLDRAKA